MYIFKAHICINICKIESGTLILVYLIKYAKEVETLTGSIFNDNAPTNVKAAHTKVTTNKLTYLRAGMVGVNSIKQLGFLQPSEERRETMFRRIGTITPPKINLIFTVLAAVSYQSLIKIKAKKSQSGNVAGEHITGDCLGKD